MPGTRFDSFGLSDDQLELRELARSLAENTIAPHTAAVDEEGRFPQEAYDALVAVDLHAPHIPEAYGGVGANALSTCLVIEEVARACASSSLIPGLKSSAALPLVLGGSEELKRRLLKPRAAGDAMFSYGLSEREAGSDSASMLTRAVLDGDHWVLNGQKSWITNAG